MFSTESRDEHRYEKKTISVSLTKVRVKSIPRSNSISPLRSLGKIMFACQKY